MNKERTGALMWRLIYPLLIFIGAEFIVEFIAMIYFIVPGIREGIFIELDTNEIAELATQFVYDNSLYITVGRALLLGPVFMLVMKHDIKYDIRLDRHVEYDSFNKWYLMVLIPAGIGAAIGFNGLVSLSGIAKYSKVYNELSKMVYNGNIFIQILAAAIAAPIVEELLFRGLIYKRLRYHLSSTWCILISAAVFGLIHGNIVQFVYAFLVGTLLAYVYEKFKTIWAPILMHGMANLSSVLITEFLPEYEGNLSIGDVMLISVIALAITFFTLKIVDLKVNRNEIKTLN